MYYLDSLSLPLTFLKSCLIICCSQDLSFYCSWLKSAEIQQAPVRFVVYILSFAGLWQFICRIVPGLPPFHCHQQTVVDMASAVNIVDVGECYSMKPEARNLPGFHEAQALLALFLSGDRWICQELEGCLSFPGFGAPVVRPIWVEAIGSNVMEGFPGRQLSFQRRSRMGKVFQNEVPWTSFWFGGKFWVLQNSLSHCVNLHSFSKKHGSLRGVPSAELPSVWFPLADADCPNFSGRLNLRLKLQHRSQAQSLLRRGWWFRQLR